MGLRYTNSHGSTVWVMICFYEAECHQPDVAVGSTVYLEPYQKMGWWQLEPGQSTVVYENDLDDAGRYWYWYANAADGSYWAGEYQESVTHEAFNLCADAPAEYQIGMREFVAGGADKHLNLT